MKRILYLSMLICSLSAMDEKFVIIKDGQEQHVLPCHTVDHDQVIDIETQTEMLDADHEHAYLCGVCDVLRDLGYGMLDLRRLEQNIAEINGYEDSRFKHSWHGSHAEVKVADTVPVELRFTSSQKKIKSPMAVPALPKGTSLDLLTNLKNRAAALAFAKSVLMLPTVAENATLSLAILEEAVLDELKQERLDQ